MNGLLAVHAHPDDETITQGATLARYAAAGLPVTVVTCTRGEQGEVIPAELAHLFGSPQLAARREAELASALAALGVPDHRYLDGSGAFRYVDSGMAYAPDGSVVAAPSPPPGAFALAPVPDAAQRLASIIREVRPAAVVSYGPDGGYGHPDHVQAHRVTMRAVSLAPVPKVYWISAPEQATATLDGTSFLPAKVAAMRAHATQILVHPDDRSFELSNGIPHPLTGVEHYRLVQGVGGGRRTSTERTPHPAGRAGRALLFRRAPRPTCWPDEASALLDAGARGVPLDRVDAVLGGRLAAVALATVGDDLAVSGLQPPAVLALAVLVQLELGHLHSLVSLTQRCRAYGSPARLSRSGDIV